MSRNRRYTETNSVRHGLTTSKILMDSLQRLTIGIVGAGQIVETNHAPVLKALGHDILWVVDNSLTKASTLASFLKCRAYSSIDDLSQATPPDVVLLACPYGARHGYYAFLANHFPHSALLIEKPIALTLAEHESIEQLRAPCKVGAFYSRRVTSMVTQVKRIVSERLLGDVRRCSIGYGGIGMLTLGRYVSNIAMAGGGTLFDNAIHELDALNFILDAQDVSVVTSRMQFDQEIEIHTVAEYDIHTSGGAVPCELVVTHLKDIDTGIKLFFDHCVARFSTFGGDLTLVPTHESDLRAVVTPASAAYRHREYEQPYLRFWESYVRGLQSGEVNLTSLCTTRLATKAIENIYRAGGRDL